jgi:hypothetical protein
MADKTRFKEARNNVYLETAAWFKKKFKWRLTRSSFKKLSGSSSIYSPHQGEQEKARRRRQIEKGLLKVTKGGL